MNGGRQFGDVDPWVSVIVPARNAASTLRATLTSVQAQTMPDWEALVVDDGSTDATAAIAAATAAADHRIRVLSARAGSAAGARNVGIAAARGTWLVFLDADDWIAPEHLVRLRDLTERFPDVEVAYCAFQRVFGDGARPAPNYDADLAADPVAALSRYCALAIHAAVVRRDRVVELGGFDAAFVTCEDWDLWLRLARGGARFVGTPACLAFYRSQTGSLSTKLPRMIQDAQRVIAIAGRPASDTAMAVALFTLWCAGAAIGRGEDGAALIDLVPMPHEMGDSAPILASVVVDGLVVGAETPREGLCARWPTIRRSVAAVCERTEHNAGAPELSRAMRYGIERALLAADSLAAPRTLDLVMGLTADPANRTPIAPPAGVDMAILRFRIDGGWGIDRVTPVFAPLTQGDVAALGIEVTGGRDYWRRAGLSSSPEALARFALRATWRLSRLSARVLRQGPRALKGAGGALRDAASAVMRGLGGGRSNAAALRRVLEQARADVSRVAPAPAARLAAPVATARPVARDDGSAPWDALFATPDPWDYGSAYEQEKYEHTLAVLPDAPIGRALELACAEGMFTRQLAPRVGALIAADISQIALTRAEARCAGQKNVTFRRIDLTTDALPQGQDLITCSEVLYYLPTVEALSGVISAIHDGLAPGGRFVQAHAFVLNDDPSRTGFDWGNPFGVATIHATICAHGGMALERSVVTDLYRVDCFRRMADVAAAPPPIIERTLRRAALTPAVERLVVWDGAEALRADLLATVKTRAVPVLMYHRIAPEGAAGSRYALPAEAFRAQMRLLRRQGRHAISPAELRAGLAQRQGFRGKPVVITFDDAYCDFRELAWPILQKSDMTADVFVVAGLAGRSAEWDGFDRSQAALMDWNDMRALATEGVRFGSHLWSHPRAGGLSSMALAVELARSRAEIEAQLGAPVRAVAAPFGDMDERFIRLAVAAGYDIAFSTDPGLTRLGDDPMRLRRIEVTGDMSLTTFTRALEAQDG